MTQDAADLSQPRREPLEGTSWRDDPDGRPLRLGAARWLCWVLHQERPDWAPVDIMAALDQVRDHAPGRTYRAALYAALEPGAPASLIGQDGPHWDAVTQRAPQPAPVASLPPGRVHRTKSHRDRDTGRVEAGWRSDSAFQAARMKARPKGAQVFGEDRDV